MAGEESAPSCQLLQLPDPCLAAVLQCCAADDQRSLFSAARAHSRLHQAAVAALRSITAMGIRQQQVDSVVLYLGKHGQHVGSLDLSGSPGTTVVLRQLPPHLQLSSLQLDGLWLQLDQGLVLWGGGAALKQLRLSNCSLFNAAEALAAALLQLPAGLEHLSISALDGFGRTFEFPPAALQRLQQLTYLELASIDLQSSGQGQPPLQPLQALTRLADLRLDALTVGHISASMLSGTLHLTRLDLSRCSIELGVLAGKTRLQHLKLGCSLPGGAAGVAELLSYLQHLQQLTHLDLTGSMRATHQAGNPPAAAYSAVTVASTLQHLNISGCTLPAGVWQHIFPAGRQLLQLQSLDISRVWQPDGHAAPAPEGSRLVSCCPGLQSLDMQWLKYSTELLAPLQGLSRLHTLRLATFSSTAAGAWQVVGQLTGLRDLSVLCPNSTTEGLLLQLTQLRQLSTLRLSDHYLIKAPSDEPVWRQLLQLLLKSNDPEVARRAAAALAE